MSNENHFVIGFYNLENFFDTVNDPHALDDDFTPNGFYRWKKRKFKNKVNKIAKAISKIGPKNAEQPPVLLGVAEVENGSVLQSLIEAKTLKDFPFDFIHFDSPDERGIDTGLIYNKDHFKVMHAETLPLYVENSQGTRDFTRDILYVHGRLNNERIHLFVNHWPSRREGVDETNHKRIKAAELIISKLNSLEDGGHNCIVMGDFNDGPHSASIQKLMETGHFINPMKKLLSPEIGSANYRGVWSLFDQIILSHSFLNHDINTHSFNKAGIFAPKFLKEWKGKYKGNPFRTFARGKYLGGYSDHFPVYVVLQQN